MATKNLVIQLPLATDGLTGSVNLATVQPTEALDMRNLTLFYGTIRKEGGTTKYNTSAITGAPKVIGGFDWWPVAGTQRMVVLTSAGNVYRDTGAGTFPTTLVAGLNMSTATGAVIPAFVTCGSEQIGNNRLLVMFLRNNAPRVLSGDGVTMAAISTPPSDWSGTTQPLCGCVAQGRLWGFLNHLGYYSNINNHQNFTTSVNDTTGAIPVFPGEGEYIMAACAARNTIIVWKHPVGIYLIDVTQPVPFAWTVQRLTRNVGIDSPTSWSMGDSDVYFTWNGQPYALSQITDIANVRNANMGVPRVLNAFIENTMNLGRIGNIQAVYYEARREFHWAMSQTGNTTNNVRMVMDLNRAEIPPRFRYSDIVQCESLWTRKDANNIPRVMAGSGDGFVRQLDVDARSIDGSTGYTSRIQTPHDDFGRMANPYLGTAAIQTRRKNFQSLEIVMEPKGNWNVSCDTYLDGAYRQTVQFNMGVNGSTLDSFVLDTNALAGELVTNKKKRLVGSGRRFSVAFYNTAAAQDFSLATAFLGVTLGADRPGTTQ